MTTARGAALSRFADKLRVIALAPGLAAGQIDLLRSQETPDILLMNVAEFARQAVSRNW
jgi:hypothetical protein